MSFHEFANPIPISHPTLGKGLALFVETGPHEAYWTVAMTDTCALITFRQNQIRIGRNYTEGRGITNEQMAEIIK